MSSISQTICQIMEKGACSRPASGSSPSVILDSRLRNRRRVKKKCVTIEPINGRLPSEQVGLGLQRLHGRLQFVDPTTGRVCPIDERLSGRPKWNWSRRGRNRESTSSRRESLTWLNRADRRTNVRPSCSFFTYPSRELRRPFDKTDAGSPDHASSTAT